MVHGATLEAVSPKLDQLSAAALEVAETQLLMLVVGTETGTGVVVRVVPCVLGTVDETVVVIIEVALKAGETGELAGALETRWSACCALLLVEDVSLGGALL